MGLEEAEKEDARQATINLFVCASLIISCCAFAFVCRVRSPLFHIIPFRDPFLLLRTWTTCSRSDSATPSSISYAYNAGSLLGLLFVVMLITGLLLACQYIGSASNAFDSVMHIMSDVQMGYIIRFMHANTASFVFIAIYAHITRNIYYSSYVQPRSGTWLIGTVIIVLAIGTAFFGYSLVYGQMSLWGATVISNLATAIPYIGTDIAIVL